MGAATLRVLAEAAGLGSVNRVDKMAPALSAPTIRPDHLLTLVDDVGIIQHANGVVASRASGYCVDDVARLAVVALGLGRQLGDASYQRMLSSALAFLQHAWDSAPDGMHNFMRYDRRWVDGPRDGDHLGRAAWALGEVIAAIPARPEASASLRLLNGMVPTLEMATSPRQVAFTVLGLSRLNAGLLSEPLEKLLRLLGGRLYAWYAEVSTNDWRWFEDVLTYDNARLPQALIAAGYRLGEQDWRHAGLEARGIGGSGVVRRRVRRALEQRAAGRQSVAGAAFPELHRCRGDEQPVEAVALVEALVEAMVATGDHRYGVQAMRVFEWFLGRNCLGLAVYDFASGGCRMG